MSTQGGAKNIGFVGLGNMGANMASNLIKAGHKLHVFDISKPACDGLAAKGATVYAKTSEFMPAAAQFPLSKQLSK